MDRHRIDEFLTRFVDFASGATTMGLLAVADRCGLLAWLSENGGGTVEEIAEGGGLDQRYVIEILSGLAAAGAVEYQAESQRFEMPPEHALLLADDSSPYYMGGWMDLVPAVMSQIDGVARAARHGGGVGFEEFGLNAIKGIDRGNAPSQRVFLTKRWLGAIPGIVDRLEEGATVADVGCGAGTAAIEMATAFPRSRVFGFDVSEESLAIARSRGEAIANLAFERYAMEDIPIDPPFDLITTFDVVHDLANPLAGLRRIREALAPEGVYLMMEPNTSSSLEDNLHPIGALFYGISALHCMTQSLAQGGAGLGAAWGRERTEEYAREAGFGGFTPLEAITNRFSAFYLLTV